MRLPTFLLALAFIFATSCALGVKPSKTYSAPLLVEFPKVQLAENERVVAFEMTVTCAEIAALRNIPTDWNIEIASYSWQYVIKGSCGHGSSAPTTISALDDVVVIRDAKDTDAKAGSCLSVKAMVATTIDFEHSKEHHFTMKELKLKREGT